LFVDPIMPLTKQAKSLKLTDAQRVKTSIEESKRILEKNDIDSNFTDRYENLRPELIENTGAMSEIVKKESDRYQGPLLGARCLKPWYNIWIDFSGNLSYCSGNSGLANVKQQSLEEFWYGKNMERERERVEKGDVDFCSHCPPSFLSQRERWRDKLAKASSSKDGQAS